MVFSNILLKIASIASTLFAFSNRKCNHIPAPFLTVPNCLVLYYSDFKKVVTYQCVNHVWSLRQKYSLNRIKSIGLDVQLVLFFSLETNSILESLSILLYVESIRLS